MVAMSASRLLGCRFDSIRVVTGAEAQQVAAHLADLDVDIVHNPDYLSGSYSSLLAGLSGLPGAAVVVPADMPMIQPEVLDQVIVELEAGAWGAVTEYTDGIGHPFGLSVDLVSDLPTSAPHRFLYSHLVEDPRTSTVSVDLARPLDVNTPADFDRLVAELGDTI